MHLDRGLHEIKGFPHRSAGCYAPGQVMSIGTESCICLFENNRVSLHSNPACFLIELRVPGASSTEGGQRPSPSLLLQGVLADDDCLFAVRLSSRLEPALTSIFLLPK